MINGIVINCDAALKILKVQFNSFGDALNMKKGEALSSHCNPEDVDKLMEFTNIISRQEASFNWEINFLVGGRYLPLKCSGGLLQQQIVLFGLETDNDLPLLYDELMKVNSDQANYVRQLAQERYALAGKMNDYNALYTDFMQLNNEMANLQRQLAGKNAELTRLNDEKNRLLGVAAHDLRSPLVNMVYLMKFMRSEKNKMSDKQEAYLNQMDKTVSYLLSLLESLLDVSALEEGKVNLNLDCHNLSSLVQKTIYFSEAMASQKNIDVKMSIPGHEIQMQCDKEKIRQVIINLFSNAVKFSPRGTQIEIGLEEAHGQAVLSVRDEGQGIAPEDMDLLFKPFQLTRSKSTDGEKSNGLGLFITMTIVEAHGGTIDVESKKGQGTKFIVRLPLEV